MAPLDLSKEIVRRHGARKVEEDWVPVVVGMPIGSLFDKDWLPAEDHEYIDHIIDFLGCFDESKHAPKTILDISTKFSLHGDQLERILAWLHAKLWIRFQCVRNAKTASNSLVY